MIYGTSKKGWTELTNFYRLIFSGTLITLSGCGAMSPGSPVITINKSIHIYTDGEVDVTYRTESSTNSMVELKDMVKDLLDLKLK